MSDLSREEIVLLNCFNYINVKKKENRKLGKVVKEILKNPNEFEKLTADKPAAMGSQK